MVRRDRSSAIFTRCDKCNRDICTNVQTNKKEERKRQHIAVSLADTSGASAIEISPLPPPGED
jgi:hypothetical protein